MQLPTAAHATTHASVAPQERASRHLVFFAARCTLHVHMPARAGLPQRDSDLLPLRLPLRQHRPHELDRLKKKPGRQSVKARQAVGLRTSEMTESRPHTCRIAHKHRNVVRAAETESRRRRIHYWSARVRARSALMCIAVSHRGACLLAGRALTLPWGWPRPPLLLEVGLRRAFTWLCATIARSIHALT